MSTCGQCGHDNPPDRRFCASCRSFLEYTRIAAAPSGDPDASGRDVEGDGGGQDGREPVDTTLPLDLATGAAPADDGAPVEPWTASGPTPPTAPAVDVDEETVRCPAPGCGRPNPASRTFCRRCASRLREPPAPPPPPPRSRWEPVRRQLTRRNLRRVAAGLLAAAVAWAVLAPGAADLRRRVADGLLGAADEADRLIHVEGQQLRPVQPQEVTASSELLAHPASAVADGLDERYWATGAPEGGVGEALVLRFAEPFPLGYVRVRGAPLRPGVAYQAHPRPQELELASDGQEVRIVLADHHEWQSFPVSLPVGQELTITLTAVFPGSGGGETAIAEIELWAVTAPAAPAPG